MSNPSSEVYRNAKCAAMFELAHPSPVVFGGGEKRGLVMRDTFTYPFAESDPNEREACLHAFYDASLGSPPKHAIDDVPIAEGTNYFEWLSWQALSGQGLELEVCDWK